MAIYDAIFRWNLWGSWSVSVDHERMIVDEIYSYKELDEVIALIGPRRAGKSTILYQLMRKLISEGVKVESILHVNFEEPEFSPLLKLALLDEIYEIYRSRVYPKGKAYIFLDEIQNVPEWERWVRARNDTEDIKIFITGLSSALMSHELATVLTGRNITFDIYPLSFAEVLAFKNISLPNKPFPATPPPEIKHALHQYLAWGGFPRVVLSENDNEREKLLRRYFDEIIFKDIVQRHEVRDVMALRNIAIHLLTNTSSLISYKRLADIFQVSADLAQTYAGYIHEAYLIELLPFYSLKASERTRNPLKIHAIDLGLRKIVSISGSPDNSKLLETLVHNALLRKPQDEIFYWKDKCELDFLIQKGITITQLIQVVYQGLNDPRIANREIRSLEEASKNFPQAKRYIITWEMPKNWDDKLYKNIQVLPLWHFLLQD